MDLVFGPDNIYLLIHPKGRNWRGIPQILAAKFKDGAPDRVATVHSLSFGENGAFFMSWTSTDGKVWKWVNFKGQYAGLKNWLEDKEKGHKSQNLCVTLGPNGSCFAVSRGVGTFRSNLPKGLLDRLNTWHEQGKGVKCVQLGVNGAFWAEASDGSRTWNLMNAYPNLNEYVQANKFTNVASLNLSPFNDQHYFLVFKNSSHARWNLPSSWSSDIRQVAQQYQQSHASSNGGTSNAPQGRARRAQMDDDDDDDDESIMSDITEGLEMTQRVAKTLGVVASTATVVAGSGCTVM